MKAIIICIFVIFLISSCSNKSMFEKFEQLKNKENEERNIPPKSLTVYPYYLGQTILFSQRNPKKEMDIFIAVDNSGSMGSYIHQVANNIEKLLTRLDESGFNYQLGILKSTEDENYEYNSRFIGKPHIVSSGEGNHLDKIINNIHTALNLHAGHQEKPVSIFYNAMVDTSDSRQNIMFKRPSAKILISLSDANEFVAFGHDRNVVDEWYDLFSRYLKNDLWTFIPIGSPGSNPCPSAENTDHWIIEQIGLKSGAKMGRICDDDYSHIMDQTVQTIFSLVRSFSLAPFLPEDKELLPENIVVKVEGNEIPIHQDKGYVWNKYTQKISFPGTYFPSEGERVAVFFEYIMP